MHEGCVNALSQVAQQHTFSVTRSLLIETSKTLFLLPSGEGHMMWKIMFLFSMIDQRGPETTQAALVRYLSEACYFPTALLPSKYLVWQAMDSNTARATLVHGDCKAQGVFHFNELGQITRLKVAQRCRLGCFVSAGGFGSDLAGLLLCFVRHSFSDRFCLCVFSEVEHERPDKS